MIVTEIDSTQEDSENCANVEIEEIIETDNGNNYDILKTLNYYLDEEDKNNDCCNLILEEMIKPITLNDELEFEEYYLSNENNSKEFKVESFTKTLKTLVDIVTEPIVDECPSISSTGSDTSENESFSIMPILKTLSTKFIKQTSKFFSKDTTDLIDLSIASSESDEPELSIIDANSGEELEGNNCNINYQIEENYLDVKEDNDEENEVKNYPTREDKINENKREEIEKKNDNEEKEQKQKREKDKDNEGVSNKYQDEEQKENIDNQLLNNNNEWNINNLAKWF